MYSVHSFSTNQQDKNCDPLIIEAKCVTKSPEMMKSTRGRTRERLHQAHRPGGCGIFETYACGFHCQKCCKWVFLMTWLKRTACYVLSWCFVGCSRNLRSATKYSPRPPPKLLSSHWLLTACDRIVVRFLVGCCLVRAHSSGNIAWGFGKHFLLSNTLSWISMSHEWR